MNKAINQILAEHTRRYDAEYAILKYLIANCKDPNVDHNALARKIVSKHGVGPSYKDIDPSYLRAYHSQVRHPTLDINQTYYGIELEFEHNCCDQIKLAAILKEHLQGLAKTETDGSLTCGREIITRPLTEGELRDNKHVFYRLLPALAKIGCRSHDTSTCGLHIHVSRSALPTEKWKQLDKLVIKNKFFKDFSRRDSYTYCEFRGNYNSNNRYRAINFLNPNTVEFRFFRGTLKPQSFFAAIELIFLLINYAKTTLGSTSTVDNPLDMLFGAIPAANPNKDKLTNCKLYKYFNKHQNSYLWLSKYTLSKNLALHTPVKRIKLTPEVINERRLLKLQIVKQKLLAITHKWQTEINEILLSEVTHARDTSRPWRTTDFIENKIFKPKYAPVIFKNSFNRKELELLNSKMTLVMPILVEANDFNFYTVNRSISHSYGRRRSYTYLARHNKTLDTQATNTNILN